MARFVLLLKTMTILPEKLVFSSRQDLRNFLEQLTNRFNHPNFIEADPISVPHRFSQKQDIEIAGLIASLFAWGQRVTILNKSREMLEKMDNRPFDFILNHKETDLKPFQNFIHRTFNGTDALYLIHYLKGIYSEGKDLEQAFFPESDPSGNAVEKGLIRFRNRFIENEFFPKRSGKHVSSPLSGSACKRLNMFLRWMVRKDDKGVDFGIWNAVSPAQLICPCDVHVERNARMLGLLNGKSTGWKMAMELTETLMEFDPNDPVKYDFALFGMGVSGEFK
jgi:uncharacterized protein (TIGR02757 family)